MVILIVLSFLKLYLLLKKQNIALKLSIKYILLEYMLLHQLGKSLITLNEFKWSHFFHRFLLFICVFPWKIGCVSKLKSTTLFNQIFKILVT